MIKIGKHIAYWFVVLTLAAISLLVCLARGETIRGRRSV